MVGSGGCSALCLAGLLCRFKGCVFTFCLTALYFVAVFIEVLHLILREAVFFVPFLMLDASRASKRLSAEALLPGGSGKAGSLLTNCSAHLDPEQQSGYSQAVGEFFYYCTFLFHLLFNGISYNHLG